MDIEDFFRDTATISAGRWVGDIPGAGGLRLKVRGTRSPEYEAAFNARLRAVPLSGRDTTGAVPPETIRRCEQEAATEALLLDWDGLTSKGAPVGYTKPIAREFITNPRSALFYDAVMWAARVVDNSQIAEEEAAVGN